MLAVASCNCRRNQFSISIYSESAQNSLIRSLEPPHTRQQPFLLSVFSMCGTHHTSLALPLRTQLRSDALVQVLLCLTEPFVEDAHEDNRNTGEDEAGCGGDVPGAEDNACIDDVGVPIT